MPPQPPSLVGPPREGLDFYLDTLFQETGDITDDAEMQARSRAFAELVTHFLAAASTKENPVSYVVEDVCFDLHALRGMIGRFQRDAFGVERLSAKLVSWQREQFISGDTQKRFGDEIANLGIRINSTKPRKTRVAAAFSLWCCVFRPAFLDYRVSRDDSAAPKFCSALNLWIATTYLSKFGKVLIGAEFREHYNRLLHDLTYRAVSLSSLELLYCGIFRPGSQERHPSVEGPRD